GSGSFPRLLSMASGRNWKTCVCRSIHSGRNPTHCGHWVGFRPEWIERHTHVFQFLPLAIDRSRGKLPDPPDLNVSVLRLENVIHLGLLAAQGLDIEHERPAFVRLE